MVKTAKSTSWCDLVPRSGCVGSETRPPAEGPGPPARRCVQAPGCLQVHPAGRVVGQGSGGCPRESPPRGGRVIGLLTIGPGAGVPKFWRDDGHRQVPGQTLRRRRGRTVTSAQSGHRIGRRLLLTAPRRPPRRSGLEPGRRAGAASSFLNLGSTRGQALSSPSSLLLSSPAHLITHPPGPGLLYSSEGIAPCWSRRWPLGHHQILLLCLSCKRRKYR